MSKFKEENFSIFAKRLEEIDWEKVEAYHQKLSKKEAISREEELPVEVYAALRCLFHTTCLFLRQQALEARFESLVLQLLLLFSQQILIMKLM